MTSSPLHLMHFEGGDALPTFRAQALLARLQAACPRVVSVAARFVHWVAFDAAPDRASTDKLAALLTYGDAYAGGATGDLVVVMPRLGTVSPWASKASDIARTSAGSRRCVASSAWCSSAWAWLRARSGAWSSRSRLASAAAVPALLHDRMTETAWRSSAQAAAAALFDGAGGAATGACRRR